LAESLSALRFNLGCIRENRSHILSAVIFTSCQQYATPQYTNLEERRSKDGGISTEGHLETQNWDYTFVLLPYQHL
jgi:hypothetical protein